MLLTLIALSGEFPTALVNRLPGGETYKMNMVKRLKKDRLLRTYYADGLRGFWLTASTKRSLLANWPEQFCPYFTGRSETNMLKSELTRCLRLYRMAEVLVTIYNVGAAVFPWQKPSVLDPGEVILQLLCDPNKKAVLDDLLAHGLSESRQSWFMVNDAMDGDSPVLFGYTCDMPRIEQFHGALNIHGVMYCFDFQEDVMAQICGQNVDIQCINFENLKNFCEEGQKARCHKGFQCVPQIMGLVRGGGMRKGGKGQGTGQSQRGALGRRRSTDDAGTRMGHWRP